MKIAAIIAEYNPFHYGHEYQIECLRKKYDGIVAIMSGNFVQRGGFAVRDKWTRAKTALLGGVDLVIELPVEYAVNTAERFAAGGVAVADGMGVVNALCFGSEEGDIQKFHAAAQIMNDEPPHVSEKIAQGLKQGLSYPAARCAAYEGTVKKELLQKPNNILGLEYVRALQKLGSGIVPETIKRIGAEYNDTEHCGKFSSAAAIRRLMGEGADFEKNVPRHVHEILMKSTGFEDEKLTNLLKYAVLSGGKEYVAQINDVGEGLENKIVKAVRSERTFDDIAGSIKSKRYTMSRIRRILFSVVLDIEKEYRAPEYIRVLGMNGTGKEILKQMKNEAKLPVVVKAADFSSPLFEKDIFATDTAYTCSQNPVCGMDYVTSPVII